MSRADRFTTQDLTSQVYSDFLTNFNVHPVSGDVVRFVNEKAVIRSIKNLINTNTGERFAQPDIGCNVRRLLFEPMDPTIEVQIQNAIQTTITNHEPRAKILQVTTTADYDNDAYIVGITIMILNQQDTTTFAITLNRVR